MDSLASNDMLVDGKEKADRKSTLPKITEVGGGANHPTPWNNSVTATLPEALRLTWHQGEGTIFYLHLHVLVIITSYFNRHTYIDIRHTII